MRKELDLTQATVRSEMDRMRDGDLAQCVSLGGWLRGTASVTSVVNKNYTQDRAELLNQPLLAEHFSKAVGSMTEGARNNKLVTAISKGLTKIRKDMDVPDGNFPPDKVQSIQNTCENLLALIMHTGKAGKVNPHLPGLMPPRPSKSALLCAALLLLGLAWRAGHGR